MRDLVLLAALVALIPMVLRAPFIGLLAWLWIALMNPQREVYTVLADFQLNFWVAVLTAGSWFFSRDRKAPPLDGFVVFLGLFAVWATACTVLALDRGVSVPLWERTMKSMVLAFAVAALVTSKTRIQAVLWVLAASIGYHAIKGGGFVVLTAGKHHVYGPEDTMIADNNNLGLALVVLLPLLFYLRSTSRLPITRLAALGTILLTVVAILGTYSRGALLALIAMGVVFALRSRSGIALLAAGALVAAVLPSIAPAGWLDRMSSIQTYGQDASFQGREAAWRTSVNLASARPLVGGGFSAIEVDEVAQTYRTPDSLEHGRAAHSIYFQVLGDTGFAGFTLYMLMLLAAAGNTVAVLLAARGRPELAWAARLARMLQVSLAAMLVGGAALSLAYYDGFLVVLALTCSLRVAVRRSPAVAAPATTGWRGPSRVPAWRAGAEEPVGHAAGRLSFGRVTTDPSP